MKTPSITLAAFVLFAVGCTEPTPTSPEASATSTIGSPSFAAQGNGVQNRVSVGGHDFVDPGVDANFSLVAIQYRDGSVSGQWSDQFGHSNGGLHVAIDCLNVIGNQAWIGGVATDKNFEGQRVITRVVDEPDQISFSVVDPAQFGLSTDCQIPQELPLFAMVDGQVKVN